MSAYRNVIFDWRHKVYTRGDVYLSELRITSNNLEHGIPYIATNPKEARRVLESLPIVDFSKYVFIDFGSGKGRMLFVAAEYPFHKIVGIEFATELDAIAKRNISNYRNPNQKCFEIESVNVDAADHPFPLGDTVVFFCNPFRKPVMEPLLARLDSSLQEQPRDVIIAYVNPRLGTLIEEMRHMKLHTKTKYFNIYRSTLPMG